MSQCFFFSQSLLLLFHFCVFLSQLSELVWKKKAQEIWGGPGATYVPRQDSKQITQDCSRQKQNHYTSTPENILKLVYTWTESDLDKAKR